MHYVDILAKFLEMFPQYQDQVKTWTPHGRCAIKVELRDRGKLDFTFHSNTDWSLIRNR
jgi:hypothetical protein